MIEDLRRKPYWRQVRFLLVYIFAILVAALSLGLFFVTPLNSINFLGFPLGFYVIGQGTLILAIVVTFWFVVRQDKIDRENRVIEDI